jgi:site-specific DNA-cytosine methylase
MSNKDIKWAILQPLINGFGLGIHEATGTMPEFIVSAEGIPNELHIKKYWPDVPFLTLNSENNFSTPEMEKQFVTLNKDIKITCGTPICAGLSSLNSGHSQKKDSTNGMGANAPQNDNMYNLARFALEKIKPEVYMFENAPRLYTTMGAPVAEKLQGIAEEYNYSSTLYKTDTYFHGVPQHRDRTFMFFWSNDDVENPKTPQLKYFKREPKPLAEYLKEIPKTAKYNETPNMYWQSEKHKPYLDYIVHDAGEDFRNVITGDRKAGLKSVAKWVIDHDDVDRFCAFIEKGDYTDKIKKSVTDRMRYSKGKVDKGLGYWEFTPVILNKPYSNAVQGKIASNYMHPTEMRGFTLRELMHLMALPHDYELVPLASGKFPENHVAQNVPVCTARDMTLNAIDFINKDLELLDGQHVRQTNYKERIDLILSKSNDEELDQLY